MYNYNREHQGREKLPGAQPIIAWGDLCNPYTREVFCVDWVESYNSYTERFNAAQDRAAQEFCLDQRHKFVMQCIDIQREAKIIIEESTALEPLQAAQIGRI